MKGDSDLTVHMNETEMAEVTDDLCTVEFIEIVPLDRASVDYRPPEFINPADRASSDYQTFVNPVVEVKTEDLPNVKQEPADESDSEVHCFSVKVTSDMSYHNSYAMCYCIDDVLIQCLITVTVTSDLVSQLK